MISSATQTKNVQAICGFLMHKINQGSGNGHFSAICHVTYYRNENFIGAWDNFEVDFDNGYNNTVTIPEIINFDSARMRGDFHAEYDIFAFDGNKLTIQGGRKCVNGIGRFRVEIS